MARFGSTRALSLSLLRIGVVAALISVSSYCTHGGNETTNAQLSPDEAYLVDAYVRIAEAKDVSNVSYAKSESLFAALDSTIDTTRVSNTIRKLNSDPDRWIAVFRGIEHAMGSQRGERESEEHR
jgi:hypothetical protein